MADEFRRVEDEVDQDEVIEEVEEEDVNQTGDYEFGGNHPMRLGSRLSNRCIENQYHC